MLHSITLMPFMNDFMSSKLHGGEKAKSKKAFFAYTVRLHTGLKA